MNNDPNKPVVPFGGAVAGDTQANAGPTQAQPASRPYIATFQSPVSSSIAAAPAVPVPRPIAPTPKADQQGPKQGWRNNKFRVLIFILVAILLLIVGGYGINTLLVSKKPNPATVASKFTNVELPLNEVANQDGIALLGTRGLVINGPVTANSSFVLSPSNQPSNATPGQIYYDQTNNQLSYFNGQKFVEVTGDLQVGDGLTNNAGTFVNSGVLTVQGQAGNVSLGAGTGISLSGTTISNTGVISVESGSVNLVVTNDGAGNLTISSVGGGSGTVISPGGTSGRIAKFTGVQTIADSLLSESGSVVTVNGDLSVTGGLSLGSALSVGNGGTGTTSLAADGVLVGNGLGAVTSVVAGASGQCLLSTVGTPAWGACTGGSTVTTLDGLSGALTIANSSGVGSTITIDNASTSQKGIAQFNATNFTAASGNINTIQDIATTSSPTFNNQTLTGDLAVNGGDITSTGALTIASAGAGNDVTINGADQFIVQDAAVFNALGTFNAGISATLADTENVSITNTDTGANSVDLLSGVLTNNSTSGTQRVALLQNAAGTGTTEALLALNNADTDTAVTAAIQFINGGGGFTNLFNVEGTLISNAEFNVLDGGIDLGTDTNGNYVASFTAGTGLTGDATGEGSTPTLSVNTANGVTTSGDNVVLDTNYNPTWTSDHTFNLSGSENIDITHDLGATVNMIGLVGTPSASAGTTRGIFLQQANSANTNGLDQGITIDNADTNLAITTGITFSNSGGGNFTNIFDILGTTLTAGEVTVLDGGIDESEVTGVITDVTAGNGLTGGAASGNATVNVASGNGGIVVNANDITLTVAPSADALSATTSSGSGLEVLASGISLLQGCSNNEILKWNEASDVWACAADGTGTAVNSFETISVPAGTAPVADSSTDTLTLAATGTNLTVTGNSASDTITFDISESALAGNGIVANGDALDINVGNGLQLNSDAVRVNQDFAFTWTADHTFNLNGTENIDITSDLNGSVNMLGLVGTPSAGAGTTRGIFLQQANSANTNGLDAGIVIDNADADLPITTGITFANSGGGNYTNIFDILGTTLSAGEVTVLDGGIDESEVTGVITDVTAGNGLTGGAASGNATVNVASGNGGIVVNANDITLTVAPSADGLSSTTSSGSGLEILATGVTMLQGCANNEILKWNEASDVWACAADGTGTAVNSFETISTPAGGSPVADSSTDTLTLLASGTNLTITGNAAADSITIDIDESVLAGTGLSNTGDAIQVNTSAGITTSGDNIVLDTNYNPTWTSDHTWNLSGTENLDITHDLGGTVNMLGLVGTPSATTGTTRGIFLQQANSGNSNGLDSGIVIDNADTDLAITTALAFTNTGGGSFTNIFDILGTTLTAGEITVLDGGIDESEVTGVITDVTAGNGLTGGAASGNATVNVASGNGGIVVNANDITLTVAPSADALSSTTSSGSGLEVLASGVSLIQGCANNEILKWNETTDVWACASDSTGGSINSFETISTSSGSSPVADSSTDTLTLNASGTNLTVTGNAAADSITLDIDESVLAGSGLGASGDSLLVNTGNGLEINSDAVRVNQDYGFTWTNSHDFNLNGTENVDITSDLAGSVNLLGLVGTPSSTSGTTRGIFLQQAASSNVHGLDSGIVIDNADTDLAITDGISFTNTGGGSFTNIFNILGTGLSASELTVLDGGIDESEVTGVITAVTAGNGVTGGGASGAVTIDVASGNGGIVVNTNDITLTVAPSADALSSTTSSGSGLEILATGVSLLQGCANNEILKWNEAADTWGCASDNGSGNTFETISTPAGSSPVADSSTDTLTLLATGTNLTITGDSSTDTITLNIDESVLAGSGLGSSGDALLVNTGNGLEVNSDAVRVNQDFGFTWTNSHDFNLNGTENVDLTSDLAGSVNILGLVGTPSSTSGTTRGIFLQQANSANTNGLDSGITIDNADADLAITSGITFANTGGGGYTTILDILGTTLSASELTVLDGGIDESEVTGVITAITAGNGITGGGASGAVTLDVASGNGGIVVNANDITLTVAPSADALSSTTSSGSGLEILATGVTMLQGCSDGQVLKWNETSDTWDCAADTDTSSNSFATISTPAGSSPVADSTTDTLTLLASGTNLTITGDSSTDSITLNIDESVLAGTGISNTGDALNINTSAGITTSGDNLVLDTNYNPTWTSDHTWNLSGTENLDVTHDLGGTVNMIGLVGTPSATTGTTRGIFLQQANSGNTNGLDEALTIDNADADLAIPVAVKFTNTGGGNFTNIFDILGTQLSAGEVTVLDGGIDESEVTGVITDVTAGNGLTGGAASGNATVNVASGNGGIVVNANDITLTVAASADALSSTTSSGSGLEVLASGLTLLQGCNDSQLLRWNETSDTWGCSDDTAGAGGVGNSFETISTPAGSSPVADSSTDTLTLAATGSNLTVTGNSGSDTITFDIDETVLAGSGLGSSGDALLVNTGNGLEINSDAVRVNQDYGFTWTNSHDFNLNGTENVDITSDLAGSVNMLGLVGTPSSTSGTTRGIFLQQASSANTNGLDNGIVIDNADADLAITTGLVFSDSGGGGFTNIMSILGTNLSASELTVLDGGIDESEVTGVITAVTAGNGVTGGGASGAVTIDVASGNGGIVVNANDITLTVAPSADALSSTTASGSGLEILATGVSLLQGCNNSQLLRWDETSDTWGCSDDTAGAGGVGNSFETISTPAGSSPVADSSTDTLTLLASGTNLTITGDSSTDTITLNIDESVLAGNGLGSSGDALLVNTGNGIELSGDAVRVNQDFSFIWTADHTYNLSGTEDLAVNYDGVGGTVDALNVNVTPSATGGTMNGLAITQANSANTNPLDSGIRINNADTNLAIPVAIQIANTGGGDYTNILDIMGTTLSAAEINVLDAGIDLGTETNGDYVASFTAGTGLTGDAVGEGSTPTISVNTSAGVTTSGDNVVLDTNYNPTWTSDHTWNLSGTENLDVTHDLGGTVNMIGLVGTPSATTGTTRGIFLQQANSANTNGLDEGITIDNADADLAIPVALKFTNSGGGNFTNIMDIMGTTLSTSELTVLDGGIDESEVTGVITAVTAGSGLINGGTSGAVTLDVASGNGGIVVNANDITLTVATSADALSSTTSSGSGMEVLASGLSLLQGCANNEILKWNEASDVWACAADGTGTAVNSFETIGVPSGSAPVADSSTDTLTLAATGSNLTVTGNSASDTVTFDIDETVLAGSGLGSSGDALLVNTGNGLEINSDAVRVNQDFGFTWTNSHDFNLNGTENVDITSDLAGSVNILGLVGTPSSTSGTTRGIFLQQANSANTNGLDSGITIDNADADLAITTGITFANTGGGYTNIMDIMGTTLSASELTVLDGGIDESEVTGVITAVTAGSGLINGGTSGAVTLDVASGNGGIVVNANDITLTVAPSADALSSTTSSGSGLEILATGLTMLQGCSDGNVLKWNETTDVWACAADTDTSSNSFATISTPAGSSPVADSTTDTLTLLATGTNLTITGDSSTDTITLDISESTLAGNGLSASGDALQVNTSNGLEINSDNVRVNQDFSFTWTADHTFNLSGTEDLQVNYDGVGGTVDALNVNVTPSATAGTMNGMVITQASSANTNPMDAALRINNADNDVAIPVAIQIANTGGGDYTNIMDIGGTLLSSGELTVLDGGIDESEVTGVITAVAAGAGLINGGTSGAVTLDVASGNGAIVVNANDITLTVAPSADALSVTTSSGSGLEVLSSGLSLLQGCSNNQILKWNETTDVWACAADSDSTPTAFIQNGNSYSAPAILGTNDSNSLAFETNNATQVTIAVGGAVTLQNSADSASALKVATQGGSAVLDVDTSNQRVGVNTSAPSKTFQVNQNSLTPGTVTNSAASPNVTGSSTTFTTTFSIGDTFTITSSGNTCTILTITSDTALVCNANLAGSSSGSAYSFTQKARFTVDSNGRTNVQGVAYFGNPYGGGLYGIQENFTTGNLQLSANVAGRPGGTRDGTDFNGASMNASMYNSGTGGTVSQICVKLGPVDGSFPHIKGAIYADSSGTPGSIVSSTSAPSVTAVAATLNCVSLGGTYTLTPNTNYWFTVVTEGDTNFYRSSGTGTSSYKIPATFASSPSSSFGSTTSGTDDIIIYAPYDTITGQASTERGLLVNANGDLAVMPSYGSEKAFAVYKSDHTNTEFEISTTDGYVGISNNLSIFHTPDQDNFSLDVQSNGNGKTALRLTSAGTSTVPLARLISAGGTGGFLTLEDVSNNVLAQFDVNGVLKLGRAGAGSQVGKVTFNNTTNSNTASIQSGVTGTSYNLTLPTALPGSTQCLQSDNTGAMSFTTCVGGVNWDAIGDPSGNGAIAFGSTVQTMDWATMNGNASLFSFNFTNTGGSAGTDSGVVINNAVSTNTTGDLNTENLLLIQQLDTTATGTSVVDNGIKIDVAANAGMGDGVEITNSGGNLTNGINIVDTAGGTLTTGVALSGTFTTGIDFGSSTITTDIKKSGSTFAFDLSNGSSNSTFSFDNSGGTGIAFVSNAQGQTRSEFFGSGATWAGAGSVSDAVAFGDSATAGDRSVSIGSTASGTANDAVGIGYDVNLVSAGAVAIGAASGANNDSVAIGNNATATGGTYSIAIGAYTDTTAANQLVIGSNDSTNYISDAYLGSGVTNTTPHAIVVHATGGSGTDIAGAAITIAGGQGTGTGNGGSIDFKVAAPGLTGSSLNSLTSVFALSGINGNANFKNIANSTQAFNIDNSTGGNLFTVDTTNSRVGINLGGSNTPTLANAGLEVQGALRLSGGAGNVDTYTTPVGATIATAINVVNFNPGAFGQIVALGVNSSADSTSRVLTLLDQRVTGHQPTLAVLSPDENKIAGLTWDGSNTDFRVTNQYASGSVTLDVNGTSRLSATSTGVSVNGPLDTNSDVDFVMSGFENFTLDGTVTGTNTLTLQNVLLTNQTSSGTQKGLAITNVNDAANATTEALIALDNAETTASTVTDGLIITSSGVNGGVVDAIDVSDANITNGINLGNNNLILAGDTINDLSGDGLIVTSNILTIDRTADAGADGLSSTTSMGSGLEVLASGITLLQGCSDTQILKWNETTDVWACAADSTGGTTAWDTIGDPSGNGAIAFGSTVQTMDWATMNGNSSLFSFNFTNTGGTAGTDSGVVINNALTSTSGAVDLNTENLLLIQQLDTTASGTTVVDNGIKVDVAANSGMTNGILVTNSAGNLTNGINIADTAGGTMTAGILMTGSMDYGIYFSNNTGVADIREDTNSFIMDLNDAATSILSITNSGAGTSAVLVDDGGSYGGTGALTIASGGTLALTLDSDSGRVVIATGEFLSTGVAGVTGATSGDFWYDTTANKFKINESGTTKTLCNTTDLGCGGATVDLQTAYNNDTDTGDTTVSLTAADDSLIFTNPTVSGTDSAFLLYLNQQNTTAAVSVLDLTQASNASDAVNLTANAIDAENALDISATALTTGNAINLAVGNNITSGSAIKVAAAGTSAIANGLVQIAHSGAYTGTGGLLNVAASATTAGTVVSLGASAATQTTTTILNIAQSGVSTGFTGNAVNITGTSTTGAGNLVNLTNNVLNGSGTLLNVNSSTTGALTSGLARFNASAAYSSGSVVTINAAATAGAAGALAITDSAAAQTTTRLLDIASSGYTTGYTGNVVNITGTSTTGGGNVVHVANNGLNGTGSALVVDSSSTGAFTTGLAYFNGSAAHTGSVVGINSASTAGTGLAITDSAAAQTTTTLLSVASSGYTTGYTGNVVSFTGVGTTGAGNVLNVTNNAINGSGTGVNINSSTTGALTSGLLRVNASAAHTGSVVAVVSASTAGTGISIADSAAAQTTTTLLDIASSGYTTGYTGNIVNVTGTGTTGAGNVMHLANNAINGSGTVLLVDSSTTGALTSGLARFNASAAYSSGSVVTINSAATAGAAGALAITDSTAAQTTTRLLDIASSGYTTGYTGNVVNITGTSTTGGGNVVHIANNGLNGTGSALVVDSSSTGAFTTGLGYFNGSAAHTGAVLGVNSASTAASTGVVSITDSTAGQTTTNLLNVASSGYTTGYTGNVVNFTGVGTTGAGNVLNVTNNAINGSGTGVNINSSTTGALTAGLLRVNASAAHTGSVVTINSASTAGTGLSITDSTAGQTSTTLLSIASSGYTTGYTGNVVSISGTSTTGASSVLNVTNDGLTTSGKVVNINSTSTGVTTGSLLYVTTATTGAVATNGIVSINATGAYTSTSNVGLVNLTANSTTSGTILNISGTALTTGYAINADGNFQFGQTADRTLSVQARTSNAVGRSLTISSGSAGSGATAFGGGDLILSSGSAAGTTGAADGGTIFLRPGTKVNAGEGGQIVLENTGARVDFVVAKTQSGQEMFHLYDTEAAGGTGHYNGYLFLGGTCCTHSTPYRITFSDAGIEDNVDIGVDDSTTKDGRDLFLYAASTSFTNGNGGDIGFRAGLKNGTGINGITYIKNLGDSTTAFSVLQADGDQVLAVDTSGGTTGTVTIGKASGITGKLTFQNGTNANTASIQSGVTGTSYTLTLPTALPGSTQCLQSTNTGTMSFTSCSGGTPSLDTILAAAGAGTAQDSNANTIQWNWDFTSAAIDSGLIISESSASTTGTQDQQALLELTTLASSTASPLQVTAGGTDVGDVFFDLTGTSDFQVRDSGTSVFEVADTGAITFAPTSGQSIVMNFGGVGFLDINPVTYTDNTGAVDIARTSTFTGVNAETAADLRINPTSTTLTEPGSGSFTYDGALINLSGIAVTAAAGTSVINGIEIVANNDSDTGTVRGINIQNTTANASTQNGIEIGSGWDQAISAASGILVNIGTSSSGSGKDGLVVTGGKGAAGTNTGGVTTITSGAGGNGGASNGGAGGLTTIAGGAGGTSTGGATTAGKGGSIAVTAGTGGNGTGISGDGGDVTITAGTAGTTGLVGNGGLVTLVGGTSAGGSSQGGYVLVQNGTDTPTSFLVKSSASGTNKSIFTVDTETTADGLKVQVGDTSTVDTPVLFVLDQEDADPTGITGAMYFQTGTNTFRCYTTSWGSCGGSGANWDTIGDPSGTGAVNMGTTVQTLDWGALTTTRGLAITSSATALTTGGLLAIGSTSTTYNHATGETGSLVTIGVKDGTTTAGAVTSTTNALAIDMTLAATTSTSGTKTLNGIKFNAPTLTSCTGGGSCATNAINIAGITDVASNTSTGLNIGSGWDNGISSASTVTVSIGTSTGVGISGLVVTAGTGASGTSGSAGGTNTITSGAGGGGTTGAGGAGGAMTIVTGDGGTTSSGTSGAGGLLTLGGGNGGLVTTGNGGNGGGVTIGGGQGAGSGITTTGGNGGAIQILAGGGGSAGTTDGDGGSITISAGQGGNFAGSATGDGGNVVIQGGQAGSGTGGVVRLQSGSDSRTDGIQFVNLAFSDTLLTADTQNNRIKIGNSTGTGSSTTLLVLDSATSAPTAIEGALYYDSTNHKLKCSQGSSPAWSDCVSSGSATDLQTAYGNDADGSETIISLTAADDGLIFRNPLSGGTDLSTYILTIDQLQTSGTACNSSVCGGLKISSVGTGNLLLITDATSTAADVLTIADGGVTTFKSQTNNAAAFVVKTSADAAIFTVDTSNSRVIIGTTTNGMIFTPASGPLYVGTGRPTKRVTLVPEYPGALMTADGTNNTGTMTSDFCSGSSWLNIPTASNPCAATEQHNFYTWTTTSQNDYDIYITYQMPSDFDGFASSTSINMYGWRTDNTATTEVQLALFEGVTQCGTTTNVATGTATWTETAMTGDETTCSGIVANDIVTWRIHMDANNKTTRAGELRFDYLSKF